MASSAASRRTTSRGADQLFSSPTGPPEHGAAVLSELGLREDGTMRRSVADRRLHGASLSIDLPDLVPARTRALTFTGFDPRHLPDALVQHSFCSKRLDGSR